MGPTEHDLLAIDPTGRFVVMGIGAGPGGVGYFERLEVVDLSNRTKVSTLTHRGAFAAAFDGSGARVATASIAGVAVWVSKSDSSPGSQSRWQLPFPNSSTSRSRPMEQPAPASQHLAGGLRSTRCAGRRGDFPGCAVFSPDAQRIDTNSIGGLQERDVCTEPS